MYVDVGPRGGRSAVQLFGKPVADKLGDVAVGDMRAVGMEPAAGGVGQIAWRYSGG